MATRVIDEEEGVFSSEKAFIALNDIFQESQDYKVSKHQSEERNMQTEGGIQDVTDLDNISTIYIETSDESEENASERRSISTESALHERTRKLWLEMMSLREELDREMALWKKEKEELQLLREQNDILAFEEATAAARAAAAAYAIESPLSSDLSNIVDITSKQGIRELAILEYERSLAKYQDSYTFEQAEQRYKSYKRVLVDAYKKKVAEVERLCNEELERLRQSADCLQPFKEIASKWSMDENDHGDFGRIRNDQRDMEQSKIVETNNCFALGKINNKDNMVPEMLPAQLN